MIQYRKTKDGQWVAFGPTTEVKKGLVTVTKKDGTKKKEEEVSSLGKPFMVDGVEHVYGYLVKRAAPVTSSHSGVSKWSGNRWGGRSGGRKSCVTDGNCSSFGSGKSCGGHDCDGF